MSKKRTGLWIAFGAVLGAAAAGISYYLKYKSFNDELEQDFHDYEEEEDFLSFTEELCSSEGNVNEEVEVPYGSRLIVMSTCIGSAPSNRFLVAAVQIDDYER